MGGVVKTLRRSNSPSRSIFSTAGSFGNSALETALRRGKALSACPGSFLNFSGIFSGRSQPYPDLGIVQKVFSEKASAIARMRQKCVKMGLVFSGRRGTFQNASEMRQKCAEHLLGGNIFWTIPMTLLKSLLFLFSLLFSFSVLLLAFLCVFPLFSKDFRGSAKRRTLAFFRGFPCFFPKKQGVGGSGYWGYRLAPLSSIPSWTKRYIHAGSCPEGSSQGT